MHLSPYIILAFSILGFGLASRILEKYNITPAIVFVTIGLLVGGPDIGFIDREHLLKVLHTLAEITLAVVLFTDAIHIDLHRIMRNPLPKRLLGIGLPFMLLFGLIAAEIIFPGAPFWQAATLAALLAPTDAALSAPIFENEAIPIDIREAINAESGLNDGIVLPFLLIALSLKTPESGMGDHLAHLIEFAVQQVTLGPIIGMAVGLIGGLMVEVSAQKKWMLNTYERLSALGLTLLAYSLAELLGGNGFIATFFAGLTLGASSQSVRERILEFGKVEGEQLTLIVFLVFGAVLVPRAYAQWDIRALLYAICSLTVVRFLAVNLSMIGSGLKKETVFLISWFGPRGIASILFALTVLEKAEGEEYSYLLSIVLLTVLISVYMHGLSSNLVARLYNEKKHIP